ncbi:acyl-CoA dehydrogenase family protein, partial [Brevibacterium litoralis]|uniref:acyl-CoA dehydrogenase family protein n=1 Tax=Brevibacterium litoralis TaxID=3138935 RepID=UPI0032ED36BE
GTMCLSEAHAGSSLADLTTRAVPQDDGTHRIHGQKMWISGGEHELSENIVHLVLARTEGAPAGVKGLSLFIVPKYLVDADGAATVLYGMIGMLGVKIWVQNRVDFSNPVNLNTAAVALIVAIADYTLLAGSMTFSGIALGSVAAIVLYHVMRWIALWRGTATDPLLPAADMTRPGAGTPPPGRETVGN